MKYRSILTVLLFASAIACNCQILYYSKTRVTPNGDTINKGDRLYQGKYIITDNPNNQISDSNYYLLGSFENGIPIGTWTEHKGDGTFAKGSYELSHEKIKDDTSDKWITVVRGLGPKKGIWYYFTKDSLLTRKVLHQVSIYKNSSVIKETVLDSSGKSYLLYYRKVWQKGGGNKFNKVLEIRNSEKGLPISINRNNFIRDLWLEYYENHNLESILRRSKIFNRNVKIEFNPAGKKKTKTITKHYKTKIKGCPSDFW